MSKSLGSSSVALWQSMLRWWRTGEYIYIYKMSHCFKKTEHKSLTRDGTIGHRKTQEHKRRSELTNWQREKGGLISWQLLQMPTGWCTHLWSYSLLLLPLRKHKSCLFAGKLYNTSTGHICLNVCVCVCSCRMWLRNLHLFFMWPHQDHKDRPPDSHQG